MDFPELGPKILIVLDNASYHKKKPVLAEIEKNLPNIQLYFLPEYSPDFNLVEHANAFSKRIYISSII